MIIIKPHFVYFYKNDKSIDKLLQHYPFSEPFISKKIGNGQGRIEYEHFDLRLFKMVVPSLNTRGIRTWQIIIEEELYNMMDDDFLYDVIKPMMSLYYLVGGNIVIFDY